MNELQSMMHRLLKEAGDLMLSYADPKVSLKPGRANFVTEADIAVQAKLMEALKLVFPNASFLAEEEKEHHLAEGLTFVIDPIDGTTNYMRHHRESVISVGAVEHGKTVFGAVFDPYHQDFYWAERGKGAWKNDTRLHVSDKGMDEALVALGTSPYAQEYLQKTADSMVRLLRVCVDVRRSGSAALDLCHVADGTMDASFEWILQPWDYCAGSLLVEEAGGKVGHLDGHPLAFDRGRSFMAANARCFTPMMEILNDETSDGPACSAAQPDNDFHGER